MEFDKIHFDGKRVAAEYKVGLPNGGAEDRQAHGTDPTPAFKSAFAAFKPFVIWVHSWPPDMAERLEVRGVSIKRPDDEPRGINVTALLTCPHARNSTSTINTPYLAEPPANYTGVGTGFLSAEVIGYVDELETQASLFIEKGERGEQTALELGVDGGAAKPKRGGKKKDAVVLGVGTVVNPDATEVVDDEVLRQLLLTVERDVPIDAIATWGSSDRSRAIEWAKARQLEILNSLKADERVPAEPACLLASATLPLSANEWSDPIETALRQLDELAAKLLAGEGFVMEEAYGALAMPALTLIPIVNPAIDTDYVAAQINDEFGHSEDNAHELAWFIQRNVTAVRDAREKPIRRDDADFGGDTDTDIFADTPAYPGPALEPLERSSENSLEDVHANPLALVGDAPDSSTPSNTPTPVRSRGKKRKS